METLHFLNLIFCTIVAVAVSEFAIKGRRVQSALNRVFPVHLISALVSVGISILLGNCFLTGLGLFWAGEFMCWFGLRSHLESSILLRMLVLLQEGPISEAALVDKYLCGYGPTERMKELTEAGLTAYTSSGLIVTQKGKRVLRIARFLRAGKVRDVDTSI